MEYTNDPYKWVRHKNDLEAMSRRFSGLIGEEDFCTSGAPVGMNAAKVAGAIRFNNEIRKASKCLSKRKAEIGDV